CWARIAGRTAFVIKNGAVRLTSNALRHSSAVRSGEACRQRQCRVVDEDVDSSEAFERAARDLVGDAVCRDVARHGEGALADFLRQRLGALAVADVHRDRGAALVQARCDSPSEAAPRTGDDGDAPRKISVFHPENCFTVPELRAPFTNAAIKAPRMMMRDLTEHKITDRKRGATLHA